MLGYWRLCAAWSGASRLDSRASGELDLVGNILMVPHDDTGAPPCRLGEPWAEHGDKETGYREAIQEEKRLSGA
jgi:hypothetical protein